MDVAETDSDATTCCTDCAEEGVHVVLDTYEGDTSLPCSSGQGTHSRSVSVEVSSLHSLSASPAVCRGKVSEAVSSGGAVGMGDVRVVESTQEFKAKKQALDNVSDESDDISAHPHPTRTTQPLSPPPTTLTTLTENNTSASSDRTSKRTRKTRVSTTKPSVGTKASKRGRTTSSGARGKRKPKTTQTTTRRKKVAKGLHFEDDLSPSPDTTEPRDWTVSKSAESSSSDDDNDVFGQRLLRSRVITPKRTTRSSRGRGKLERNNNATVTSCSNSEQQTSHHVPSHSETLDLDSMSACRQDDVQVCPSLTRTQANSHGHQLIDELFGDESSCEPPVSSAPPVSSEPPVSSVPRVIEECASRRGELPGEKLPLENSDAILRQSARTESGIDDSSFGRSLEAETSDYAGAGGTVAVLPPKYGGTGISVETSTAPQSDMAVDIDQELFGF